MVTRKSIFRTFVVCLTVFTLFAGHALGQAGRTYALVVGIAKYRDQRITPLQFADRDAREFNAVLSQQIRSGFPPRTRLLINEEATVGSIYGGMTWLNTVSKPKDTVIIYFAGHGDLETDHGKGNGYLLAYDSPANNYPGNAIDLRDLNKLANQLSIGKGTVVILITDACHSGKLAGDFQEGKKRVAANLLTVLSREVRMAACLENELSEEASYWGGGRGVFSYYLTKGMQGEADVDGDRRVTLEEIRDYIRTAFREDRYLKEKNRQTPYIDGPGKLVLYNNDQKTQDKDIIRMEQFSKLASFGDVQSNAVERFFNGARIFPLENCIDFRSIEGLPPEAAATSIPGLTLSFKRTSLLWDEVFSTANLERLVQGVEKENAVKQEFLENLVTYIQSRSQEMINAYLEGDLAELQRRQYYSYAQSNYTDFIQLMDLAIGLLDEDDFRLPVLRLQRDYLHGLSARLSLAFTGNKDSLLAQAFASQRSAMNRDPYAAYVHNEIGNLFLFAGNFDSSLYHFRSSSDLAPTWAIPWSNLIRLHVMTGHTKEANLAMRKADSLQPGLFSTYLNGGIAAERSGDLLRASDLYNRSISANPIHFMPYEQLGMACLRNGNLSMADSMLHEASWRTRDFRLHSAYFDEGISMSLQTDPDGLPAAPDSSCLKDPGAGGAVGDLNMIYAYLDVLTQNPDEGFIDILLRQRGKYPGFPYLDHYIGDAYEKRGDTIQAIRFLKTAATGYMHKKQADAFITRLIRTHRLGDEGECLKRRLLRFQYRKEYDLLALARLDRNPAKAMAYLSEARQLQDSQLPSIASGTFTPMRTEFPLEAFFEMVETLRSKGKWRTAEKMLLQQARFNDSLSRSKGKTAALAPGYWCSSWRKDPWKMLNQHLEAFIIRFYDRILAMDDRNPYWHLQKAMFLFGKISNVFGYATSGIGNHTITEAKDPNCGRPSFIFFRRTGEKKWEKILLPDYDPISESKSHFWTYRSLAGSLSDRSDVLVPMARLYIWSGPRDSALMLFAEAVRAEPANLVTRNELARLQIDLLHWQDAWANLSFLYQKGALPPDLQPELCRLTLMKGDTALARSRIRETLRRIPKDSRHYFMLYNLMAGTYRDPVKQLAVLDSMPTHVKNENKAILYYQKAGLHAILNDTARALDCLDTSIASGFDMINVLNRDVRFDDLRKTEAWKVLTKKVKSRSYPAPSLTYGLKRDRMIFNE